MNQTDFAKKTWLIRNIQNWREILAAIKQEGQKPDLILKNGFQVALPQADIDYAGVVYDFYKYIFIEQIYTQGNFYQPQLNDVIIDIGGHIGLFALFCQIQSQQTFNNYVEIHCFEPYMPNFELLQQNIVQNHLEDFSYIYPYALLDHRGEQELWGHESYSLTNPSFFRNFVTSTGESPHFLQKSSCITLDDAIEMTKAKQVNFLKIHCEGAEIPILSTASKAALHCIHKMAVICHPLLQPNCRQIVENILKENNFSTLFISGSPDESKGGVIQAYNLDLYHQ